MKSAIHNDEKQPIATASTKKVRRLVAVCSVLAVLTVSLAVGWGVYGAYNNALDYYHAKCSSFALQNRNLSKGQIVFVGDSITDAYPLDDYYADLPLAVYNRGIGGDTTDGVSARMDVSLYALQPAKIVLMIGTNDVNGGKNNEYIVQNYTRILQQIHDCLPQTQVFCMSVLPQNEDFKRRHNVDVDAHNAAIQALNVRLQALA